MKVLIVDDSKFSQMSASNLLKKAKAEIEIYFASDGMEGFEKYKELRPDFALIDLLMPVLNGKELVKRIKEYDREAKLIVVSADVQKSVQEEVMSLGARAFVNKPLNEDKAKQIFEIIQGAVYGE